MLSFLLGFVISCMALSSSYAYMSEDDAAGKDVSYGKATSYKGSYPPSAENINTISSKVITASTEGFLNFTLISSKKSHLTTFDAKPIEKGKLWALALHIEEKIIFNEPLLLHVLSCGFTPQGLEYPLKQLSREEFDALESPMLIQYESSSPMDIFDLRQDDFFKCIPDAPVYVKAVVCKAYYPSVTDTKEVRVIF